MAVRPAEAPSRAPLSHWQITRGPDSAALEAAVEARLGGLPASAVDESGRSLAPVIAAAVALLQVRL